MKDLNDCPICETESSVFGVKMSGVDSWVCENCGYQTNEGMIEGSDLEKSLYDIQPELFKDLKLVDKNRFVWYPTILNEKNKAMLFPDGKNTDDWGWRVAKEIPISENDRSIHGQTHKLDMVNSSVFPPLMFPAAIYLYYTFLKDED
jgi:hypothetical protein